MLHVATVAPRWLAAHRLVIRNVTFLASSETFRIRPANAGGEAGSTRRMLNGTFGGPFCVFVAVFPARG